jgi:hypothetical protein
VNEQDTPKTTHPCPKCNRTLIQSGELIIDGVTLPTFQCDECLVNVDFAGEQMEIALTFCVSPDGRVFDPADPEGELRF